MAERQGRQILLATSPNCTTKQMVIWYYNYGPVSRHLLPRFFNEYQFQPRVETELDNHVQKMNLTKIESTVLAQNSDIRLVIVMTTNFQESLRCHDKSRMLTDDPTLLLLKNQFRQVIQTKMYTTIAQNQANLLD